MRRAELFDGTTLEFPDETSDEVIARVARVQTDRIRTEQARRPLPTGVAPGNRAAAAAVDPRRTDFTEPPGPVVPPSTGEFDLHMPEPTEPGTFRGRSGETYRSPTMDDRALAADLAQPTDPTVRPFVGPPEAPPGYKADVSDIRPGSMVPFGGGGRREENVNRTDPVAAAVSGSTRGILDVVASPFQAAMAAGELTDTEALAGWGRFAAQATQEARDRIAPSDPKSIVQQTFESVFTNVPVIAGLGFGNRALVAMGSISAAQSYQEAVMSGVPPQEAADRAAAHGLAEMLGEKVALPQLGKLFKQAAAGVPTAELGRTMAGLVAKEQAGEQATTAMQDAYDKFGAGGTKPGMGLDAYIDDAIQTAKVTLGQTLVMGGAAAGSRALQNSRTAGLGDIAATINAADPQFDTQRAVDWAYTRPSQVDPRDTAKPGTAAPAAAVAPPFTEITTHDMPAAPLTPEGVEALGGPTIPKVADGEKAQSQQGVLAAAAGDLPTIERGALLTAAEERLRQNASAAGADATGTGPSVPAGGAQPAGGVGPGVAAPSGTQLAGVGDGAGKAAPSARPTLPVPAGGERIEPLKYEFKSIGAAQAYIAQERLQNVEAVRAGNEIVLRPKLREPTDEDALPNQVAISMLHGALVRAGAGRLASRMKEVANVDPQMSAFAEVARAVTGQRPIFVSGLGWSGVASNGRVFLNLQPSGAIKNDQKALAVTWHEVTHTLEQTDPDLYDAYAKVVGEQLRSGVLEQRIKSEQQAVDLENARGGSLKAITSDAAIKEIHADIGGGLALQPKFWERMIELDASAAKRLLYHFMRVATKLIRVAKGSKYDVSHYVKDVEAVRDAYAKALAAKSGRSSKPASGTSEPRFERQEPRRPKPIPPRDPAHGDVPRRLVRPRPRDISAAIKSMDEMDVRDELVQRHGLTRSSVDAMGDVDARLRLTAERAYERQAGFMVTPPEMQRQIDAAVEAGARMFDKKMARVEETIADMQELIDNAGAVRPVTPGARAGEMEPVMTPEDEARLNSLGAFNLDAAGYPDTPDESFTDSDYPDPTDVEEMRVNQQQRGAEQDILAETRAGIDGQENYKHDSALKLEDVTKFGYFGEEAFKPLSYQKGDPRQGVEFAITMNPGGHRNRATIRVNKDPSRPDRDGLFINSPPTPSGRPPGSNGGHWHGVKAHESAVLDNQVTHGSLFLHGLFPNYFSKDVALKYDLATTVPGRTRRDIPRVWRAIGEIPGALRFQKSGKVVTAEKADMLQKIADRMLVGSGYKVNDILIEEHGRVFNMEVEDLKSGNRSVATIEYVPVAKSAGGQGSRLIFHTSGLPKGGGIGSAVYQVGQEFAYQLGVGTQADPMGLSGINTRRRTEQMLSAAVRNPIGGNFRPGFAQRVYGWNPDTRKQENIDMNLARLAIASLRNTAEVVPEVKDRSLSYNIATGEFTRHGRPFKVDEILARPMARDNGISRSQLARAAITTDIIKGKDPSKDVQAAATDVLFHRELDEGEDTDPYAIYRGRDVTYTVRIGDTGQTAEVTVDLGRAFDELDQREAALRKLQECLA